MDARRGLRVRASTMVGAVMFTAACAVTALSHAQGDPRRGEAIVRDRTVGMCLLCHSGPFPDERFQGNLAPPLDGAGTRHTRPELRARVEDNRRYNPNTIMPAFARASGFTRVGSAWENKPILDTAQIEDVVAFLETLR
jgi:L-cysteine S-thiosulfotransferase